MFESQNGENHGLFSQENLSKVARELGLDGPPFDSCLTSDRHLGQVQAERDAARQKGVYSTPTMYVNGIQLVGVPTYDQLRQVIDRAPAAPSPAP